MDNETTVIGSLEDDKITKKIADFLKSDKFFKALEWGLFLVFCFQFVMMVVFNLTQNDNHVGYDASTNLLKDYMVWEQRSLVVENYSPTTGNNIAGVQEILVAAMYGLTGDLFIAQGIVNIASACFLLFIIAEICRLNNISRLSSLMIAVLALTPHSVSTMYNVANPLDYYSCMFFSAAFYQWSIITVLLGYLVCLEWSNPPAGTPGKVKALILSAVSLVLLFFSGLCGGIIIFIYLIIPCVLWIFASLIWDKTDFKKNLKKSLLVIFLQIAAVIGGIAVAGMLTAKSGAASSMQLVLLGNFFNNIVNVFLGWGKLLGVLPVYYTIPVLSIDGITCLIRMLLFLVFICVMVHMIVCMIRKRGVSNHKYIFIAALCLVNFAVYFFINSTYGAPVFEERYLILYEFLFFFALGMYFSAPDRSKTFTKVFASGVLVFTCVMSSFGFKCMDAGKTDLYAYVRDELSKYDAPLVYYYADNDNLGRNMRACDTSKVYRELAGTDNLYTTSWGDYTYYGEATADTKSLLICPYEETFNQMNEAVRSNYSFAQTLVYGNSVWYLYKSNTMIDFEPGLPDEGTAYNFPGTPGVCTSQVDIVDGLYTTNGAFGYDIFGPYAPSKEGTYVFTLSYSVKESVGESAGVFDIAVDLGNNILGSADILADQNEVSVTVTFDGDMGAFEHRLLNFDGSVIEISNIEMQNVS